MPVFSPQPMQEPSPPTMEWKFFLVRRSVLSTPIPSSMSLIWMNRSGVSGSFSHTAQFRLSLATVASSCLIVTSALSGQTSTQRLHPLQA